MKQPQAYLNIGGTIKKLTAKNFPYIHAFYSVRYTEILKKYTSLQEQKKKDNIPTIILAELPSYAFLRVEWNIVEKEVKKKVEWISICSGASDSSFVVLRKADS